MTNRIVRRLGASPTQGGPRTVPTIALLGALLVLTLVGASSRAQETADQAAKDPGAAPPLEVTGDLTLDPNRVYGELIIKASNITIDGRGAKLLGPRLRADAKSDPKSYRGTAIIAAGVSNVTLKNVVAKGWETGLRVSDGERWTITGCDFSDNFHDPKFGWGENGRRGGLVLEKVRRSTIRGCRANRVWDACVLVDSDDNRLEDNDFSRTSNTCLKLWTSSRNVVEKNNLSYGIRKDPGEVHARDSTCVLIESGSNDNRFLKNDCRYGGDGIFIRVLNGWVSAGNYFEENDCSYANNNCVEAWSPRNKWVRNKANHGSYGFWLGASDQNVLIDNEASFNGLPDGNHNSPHLPDGGHAGIVFMFGPSSHTILRGNRCQGNHGAGIAAIGDQATKGKKWNAFHWVVENNQLIENRWGIYLQHVEMFDLSSNGFANSEGVDLHGVENLIDVRQNPNVRHETKLPPVAKLDGPAVAKPDEPTVVRVGQEVRFDASASTDPQGQPLTYRWRTQPTAAAEGPIWKRTFDSPGFYRLALTVHNGRYSDLAWRDVYAVRDLPEFGSEGNAAGWDWIDPQSKVTFADDSTERLIGKSSLRAQVSPYGGGRVTLRYSAPSAPAPLAGKSALTFWLKKRNEHVPAWQDVNPLVELQSADGKSLKLTPKRDLLSEPPYLEAREGWTYFRVPLAGDETWKREGDTLKAVKSIRLGFDSWGAPPLWIWIDGLSFE